LYVRKIGLGTKTENIHPNLEFTYEYFKNPFFVISNGAGVEQSV
jgi:hypothetical protein